MVKNNVICLGSDKSSLHAMEGRDGYSAEIQTFSQVGLSLIVISASESAFVTFERFKNAAERLL
jgi:hypothetical protein